MIVSAVLGATELPLASGQQIPSLVWQGEYRAGGRADMPRFSRQLPPDNRTIPLEIVKEAEAGWDTHDLDLWLQQVDEELSHQNVLVVESDDGSVATFNTQPSDPLERSASGLYRFGLTYRGVAQIVVEPFGLGASASISSEGQESPGSISLASMDTVYPTPLTISASPSAGLPDFHCLYLALCEELDWDFVVEATDVAGWDDEVADGGLGVNVVRFAAGGSYDVGYVDTSGMPASPYLVLARVKADTGGTISLDSTYKSDPEVTDDLGWYHWIPLGEVALPTRRVRGSAQALLDIQGKAATAACYVQRLAFLPLRWGFLSYHPVTAADASSLRAEWEDVYVDDVVDYEAILGGGIKAKGGHLLVLSEEVNGTLAHHHLDVTVDYRPRRNWLG